MMEYFPFLTPAQLAIAFAIALLAGVIKGVVGFAMPTVLMSGLGMFLPPELALAGVILPTVVTNGFQALRQGWQAAAISVRKYAMFLGFGAVFLVASAQLVRVVPESTMLLMIGAPITLFVALQLIGLAWTLTAQSKPIEALFGASAGAIGGISGIWGPLTVMYLTALDTPKAEQMRVQGVIFGLGSVLLLTAHAGTGVIRGETLPLSVALVPPAVLGMWAGRFYQDRIDQATFRRATLLVLLVAGLNLMRRGLVG